jgi:hypothetical protein
MPINLKYVDRFWDRYGSLRHYFRRPGQKAIPLPGKPGSPEFITAYAAALAREQPAKRSRNRWDEVFEGGAKK